jgi:hypothetical protein
MQPIDNTSSDYANNLVNYLLPISILYAFFSHWQSLNGGFLSDTYAIYASCYRFQQEGALWSTLLALFWEGLSNGGVDVYRPLGFVFFCGEFSLFGNSPFILKSIQFGLHLLNSLVLYFLTKTVFKQYKQAELTAVFAAIFFLFSPVSPEVSMWIAAKYDSLAQFFMLLTCLFYWQNKRILAIIAFILALCSKESAIVLPAMLFSMSYLRSEFIVKNFICKLITALKQTWPYWLLLLIYMATRFFLFDGAFHIYEQKQSFFDSFVHNISIFPQVFSRITLVAWYKFQWIGWFWAVFFSLVIISFWINLKNNTLNKWLMFFSWIVITLLALVSQIGSNDSSGAGARVLYSVSTWFAVIFAMPLLHLKKKFLFFYLIVVLILIYIQSLPIKQWTQAAVISKKLLSSIKEIPALDNDKQWSLVLTPEHIGVGLLGRNAQGGFSLPPFRKRNMLDEMVPFVRSDLENWRNRLNNNFVVEFKKNVKDPNQYPTRYYCTHKKGHVLELQIEQQDLTSKQNWANKWKQQTNELDCYF